MSDGSAPRRATRFAVRVGQTRVALAASAGVLGALLVWLATAPRGLVHINWDAGSYLHQIASGTLTWSSPPWNAHFALQYAYLAGTWVAGLAGGSATDGFRLLNAVCFGLSAALIADATRHLLHSRLLAGLLTATWATAFVTCFLVFTLEDNIVFLTPAVATLWLCVLRLEKWSWRECLAAGLLGAGAGLYSVQGVLYLAPSFGLTLFVRPGTIPWWRRVGEAALIAGGCAGGAALFVLLVAATSSLGAGELFGILLSRPEPSHFPETPEALRALLLDWRGSLRAIGIAVSFQLFQNRIVLESPEALVRLGAAALASEMALWATTAYLVWRRKEGVAAYLMAATLLLFTLLTSLYRDVEYAYLKRTDFLPLVGTFALAAAFGPRSGVDPTRRRALAATLALVAGWQTYATLAWRNAEVAGYATLDTTILQRRVPDYHGTPSGPYFRRFRALREDNPRACAFVFDLPEVAHGRWNPDITGLLWSELPTHMVIVSPAEMKTWRRPIKVFEIGRTPLRGCEWLSEGARRHLGKR